jgi:tetratricopeptide (TPR) repeat protein
VAGDGANADIVALRYARKNLQLLSRVLKGTGDITAAGEVLDQAISVQQRVISIARRDPAAASLGVSMAGAYARLAAASSNVSAVDVDRLEAADLHLALGNFCEREAVPPQDERAKRCYVDASHFSEGIMDSVAPASTSPSSAKADGGAAAFALPTTYERSLLALARLHLRRAEIDECRNVCSTITKSNPGNEEASVMLADLLFRQNDTAAATYHFSTLLERRPNAYEALARLITLLRRAGRLQDAQKFLRQAIRAVPSAEVNDAGYRFCKALYCWYNNEPHEAIKLFNSTRLTGMKHGHAPQ